MAAIIDMRSALFAQLDKKYELNVYRSKDWLLKWDALQGTSFWEQDLQDNLEIIQIWSWKGEQEIFVEQFWLQTSTELPVIFPLRISKYKNKCAHKQICAQRLAWELMDRSSLRMWG